MVVFFYYLAEPQVYQQLFLAYLPYAEIISLTHTSIYIYLTRQLISHAALKNFNKKWLNILWLLIVFLWLVWMVYAVIDHFFYNYNLNFSDYYPLDILVVMLLYVIGISVFANASIFQLPKLKSTYGQLKPDDSQQLVEKLNSIMTNEQVYLNPELNLEQLAEQISIHPKMLSFILNEKVGKNFNDYINEFRVEEVKKRLLEDKYSPFTILAIAQDCGFQSKSTFNTAFKKIVGITPSAFRKKHLK